MPNVSIVLPTYNRANLLPRSIQSILSQAYQDFEIIVIDDASTDNTEEVIRKLNERRIVYVKQSLNRGEAAARNVGIGLAKGRYIAFQDSDDESLPERIEREVKVLKANNSQVGIVYTDAYRIQKDGRSFIFRSPHIRPKDCLIYLDALNYRVKNIGIGTSMIRRECFKKVGLFDEKLKYFVDLDFFIRASKYFQFYHIPMPLLKYYEEGNNEDKLINAIEARKIILEKYYEDINKNKKTLSIHYFNIGNDLCYAGQTKLGRRYIIKSIAAYPIKVKYLTGFFISFLGAGYSKLVDAKNVFVSIFRM